MSTMKKSMMLASFLGTTAAALSAIMSPKRQEIIDDMMKRSNTIAEKAKIVTDNVYEGLKTLTIPKSNRNNIFMTGAVLGALIGAGSTFLLSPRTGKQVRNSIAKRYQDMALMAQETMDAINNGELVPKHSARKAVSHAKKTVSHAKASASRSLKKAKSKISSHR